MKKIIVIDDEPDFLTIVSDALSKEGFQVITSEEPEDGYNKILSESPDLAIIDINLPNIDGFKLCQKIRENPQIKNIPIIMLTIRRKEEDKIRGLETGADDYISKPFHPSELIARIKTVLRRTELAD
jgi:DNA-binding response OmpR family regulator